MSAPAHRHGPAALTVALILALALGLVACGDSADPTAETAYTPSADLFPAFDGTLEQIAARLTPSDLVVSPSGQVFHEGRNRYGFGVFTLDHGTVPDAQVALYVARPDRQASGPYPATAESLDVPAPFRSQTAATDPDAARAIYTADIPLDGPGEWRVLAVIADADGNLSATNVPSAVVGQFPKVPQAGDKAPLVHTPTAEDVGGDLAKIDTRQPPDTMHAVDLADVLGKQPVVLLFATPALCTSRVCGPVVDIAEQVKSERPDDAAFIHMEIYEDNTVDKGVREQVKAYHLPSEPWLFVIDSNGRISTEIEGGFSTDELNAALDKLSG